MFDEDNAKSALRFAALWCVIATDLLFNRLF
jgi:hypothetical protein